MIFKLNNNNLTNINNIKTKIIIFILILIILLVILIIYFKYNYDYNNKNNEGFEDSKEIVELKREDGINNIDQILFINLDNRKDRLEAITKQLKNQGVNMEKVHRIIAHYTPGNGHLGCSKSHRDAVQYALNNNFENIIILEDDFKFNTSPEETKNLFNKLFNEVDKMDWDVIMLDQREGIIEKTKYSFLNKITNAIGGFGYIINKKYYQILIDTFQKSVDNMSIEKTSEIGSEKWSLDQVWKVNQKNDKWLVFDPLIGKHDDELFSSIETITNYNK